jgi:xylan 1,4-beta-xylosidase
MKASLKPIAVLAALFLIAGVVLSQPAENPRTFCNPMNLNYRFMADAVDAREAADPVMVLYQDEYYLFASRSGGYWISSDLATWDLIVPTGLDVETYAPGVFAMRDSLFYIPSNNGQIYKSGDPKSGVWTKGPYVKTYGDPAFFLDDDGRLYMYYGLSNTAPIRVVELDPMTFTEISAAVDVVHARADIHGWERRGDDNLLDEQPWIEGSWMVKHKGTYYLQYAGPGTEFKTYSEGVYTSDSPMGPFTYADYSPVDFKPTGFLCGAGHGSTFQDKAGQYWHIGTMTISVKHMFERRLGLFPVTFDEDGQLRTNTVFGDYPQFLPGIQENHVADSFAGMFLLSHSKYVTVSSSLEDHPASMAVDEDARTYWSAQTGGDEWMLIDLGIECSVEAVQVNFAEQGTTPSLVRGRDVHLYEQYLLETSLDGIQWDVLVDKSQNQLDVPHDYIELSQAVQARYIRLTNIYTPGNGNFAVRDLRVFGNSEQAEISTVINFTVERDETDGRDAIIRWSPVENADGYVILYGVASDKLYNNYMVYNADSVAMHSLNHGVDYFFDVNAFDSGTAYYNPIGEFRSGQSGDWNDMSTWAFNDGDQWLTPAPRVPSAGEGVITVMDGHTVTISQPVTADQLHVASGGVLIIEPGVTFNVDHGIGADLMAEGDVINRGTLLSEAGALLNFTGSGRYIHQQDGGELPSATWRKGSSCVISGVVDDAPSNGNQDFYHIMWDCSGQTGNESMKWNGNTIGGNITIANTGSGRWQMCAPSAGTDASVTIEGNIIQTDGQFSSNGTSNANTHITIQQSGNIRATGGNFSVSRGSQGGSGSVMWIITGDTVSIENATTQNSNSQGARFIFRKSGLQNLILNQVNYSGGGFPVEVDSGAVLSLGESILEGNGDFIVKAGAGLLTAHPQGLDASLMNTGAQILDPDAGFGFNGTVPQVTGLILPDTIARLVIHNTQGVTLSKDLWITGTLEMNRGRITDGPNKIHYGETCALLYSGEDDQTTTDVEFPELNGPFTLIINNERDVILHASRSVNDLMLYSSLELGTNTLTVMTVDQQTDDAYIVTEDGGSLRIPSVGASSVLFPVGVNGYSPVWITNHGTPDAVQVSAIRDREAAPSGGRVNARWTILEDNPGSGDFTLQFGWTTRLENTAFRNNREKDAKIFNLTSEAEAGSGDYTVQLDTQPMWVARSGITELGEFVVGNFTGLSVDELAGSVLDFNLSQNYPNPFNPETRINFSVDVPSHVTLVIYDVLGRQVTILIDKQMDPGHHSFIWDASGLASGLYFCRLSSADAVKTRKMVLMR